MKTPTPPTRTRPARLDPIPRLPVFLDLQDKPALVTGGGPGSAWKAELLAAAGARVTVHAAEVSDELAEVAAACATVTVTARPWADADIAAAAIVIGGDPGPEAERLAAAARRLRVPVNVIDTGPLCDFTFGAIVNRAPVVVAISSDGASPVLAQAIRRRVEAVLPPGLGAWAASAKRFRDEIARAIPDRAARRRYWEAFTHAAFTAVNRSAGPPPGARWQPPTTAQMIGGEVAIVGAGPGDPELVTLAAIRELQAADVILYDRLVAPAILELARREARRVLVGKAGHGASVPQSEITALAIAEARGGARVVRLKGGDPAIFARTGEEVAACRAAGVPVRIVPGVTTASAAAAALGLSLTHRDHGRRVQFLSGHDTQGTLPAEAAGAFADPGTTTVAYMGRRTATALADAALAQGMPPGTPAILAVDVGGAGERHVRTTLAGLGDVVAADGGDAPLILLIGTALGANVVRADPN